MDCAVEPSAVPLKGGWIFRVVERPAASSQSAVVMFHGFTGDHIEAGRLYVDIARSLCALGFPTVRFDYRNHGDSSGPFEEFDIDNAVEDAEFIVRGVLESGFKRLAFVGFSMGGSVALSAYLKFPEAVGALVLLAPAVNPSGTPLAEAVGASSGEYFYFGPYRMKRANLLKQMSHNLMYVADLIKAPTLLIHARDDQAVPYTHTEEFYRRLKSPKRLVSFDRGGHTFEDFAIRSAIVREIEDWLKAHL
ncbi:MAG: alpha/beta fold hydrolase [Thermoproteus sp.]